MWKQHKIILIIKDDDDDDDKKEEDENLSLICSFFLKRGVSEIGLGGGVQWHYCFGHQNLHKILTDIYRKKENEIFIFTKFLLANQMEFWI